MALVPTCPAAEALEGPPTRGPSIICGVLRLANRGATLDGFAHRAEVSPLQTTRDDPSTVAMFCCGTGVPTDSPDALTPHHTACPIWRAEREADWAQRSGPDRLHDRAHRRAVLPTRQNPARVREQLDQLRVRD